MNPTSFVFPVVRAALVVGALAVSQAASLATCLAPPGDLNGNGVTNVVDVQCGTVVALWTLSPFGAPPPECIGGDLQRGDATCDGITTVADVQVLINYSLSLPLGVALDGNGNGCPDACDPPPVAIMPGDLVITEVMVNPKLVSDGLGEWFEVHNTTGMALNLAGLIIRDDGTDTHTIAGPWWLDAGEYAVFGRSADTAANGGVPVDYAYTNVFLSNSFDEVVLELGDIEIDRVAYTEVFPQSVGIAMSLDSAWGTAGTNDNPAYWCVAKTAYGMGDFGTPGQQNPSCFTCGNGVLEIGEECDNGAANSDTLANACRTDCTAASCGDGVCDSTENCGTCPGDCGECGAALCGGVRCHVNQQCIAGQCVFSCTGVQVPGDYAAIQAAVTALSPAGGTICVKPGSYAESLVIAPQANLTIIGASATSTAVTGSVTVNAASAAGTLTVRGIHIANGVFVNDTDAQHPIALESCRIRSQGAFQGDAVRVQRDNRRPVLTVRGCDIAGTAAGAGVRYVESANFSSSPVSSVMVENCYVHDCAQGVALGASSAGSYSDWQLTVRNNSLVDLGTAVLVQSSQLDGVVSLFNNVIAESDLGVDLQTDNSVAVGRGGNAYSNNGTNLAGMATFAATDLQGNVALDDAKAPPELLATSPAIGAAVAPQAPATDYWGQDRDQTPDIGAVEFLCSAPPCGALPGNSCGDGVCGGGETCASCGSDCGACSPGPCGGACDADELCVAGQCILACSGAKVPGDYATLQGAVTALQPIGGTICVGAGTFTESIVVAATASLTIQGASRDITTLSGSVTFNSASNATVVKLRGMHVTGGIKVTDTQGTQTIALEGLIVRNTASGAQANGVNIRRDNGRPIVRIDRCDISGSASASAVYVEESANFSSSPAMDVRVRDSYLHDAGYGLHFAAISAGSYSDTALTLVNTTISDCGVALGIDSSQMDLSLAYYNNAFVESGLGVDIDNDSSISVVHGNNAFAGNITNFAGKAVPSATDVYGTPGVGLDAAKVPPSPLASSALIGKGNGNQDSGVDYFGRTRDATPDIGAVELMCASPPCQAVGVPACGDGACNAFETCASCPGDCGSCNAGACAGGCEVGAQCVAGQCIFACSGARVPGDYADIQSAVIALQPVGGTICIGAGAFAGTVTVEAKAPLVLQGVSRTGTVLTGTVNVNSGSSASLKLQHLSVDNGLFVNDTPQTAPVHLAGMMVRNITSVQGGAAVQVRRDNARPDVTIDRCNLAGTASAPAVSVVESANFSSSPVMVVRVRDSYLHHSGWGLRLFEQSASSYSDVQLVAINNTISECGTGISIETDQLDVAVDYRNNVISLCELGVYIAHDSSNSITHGSNAFGGNLVNFDGKAIFGAGDVKANLALNASATPPTPAASSSLIGAANGAVDTGVDYFGRTRDATPDIGAVEYQCASAPCVAVGTPACGDGACNASETCATCQDDCGVCSPAQCPAGCAADEQCVAGTCTLPCSGAKVPGDYDSIQQAINALQPVGGTICVAAGTFVESPVIAANASLSIVGISRKATTVQGSATVNSTGGTSVVHLEGFKVTAGVKVQDTSGTQTIELRSLDIENSAAGSSAYGVHVRRDNGRPIVRVDRCNVSGGITSSAVFVEESANFSSSPALDVRVRDSYLHHVQNGFRFAASSAGSYSDSSLLLVNNTLSDCGTAISVEASSLDVSFAMYNNAVVKSGVGVSIANDAGIAVTRSNTAYSGNSTNLAGKATLGPGDITDVSLGLDETTQPPGLLASSVLIGAGNGTYDTGFDFHGRVRDVTPDIGAVERQCASPPCVALGAPVCGDGACNGTETCASCASDCGACTPSQCPAGCEVGEQCVDGSCILPCSGAMVPGDYATIQSAVTALQPVGGTICVGAGTFVGNVAVSPSTNLTIQGISRTGTTLDGTVTMSATGGTSALKLQAMTISNGLFVSDTSNNNPIQLVGLRVRNATGAQGGAGVQVRRDNGRPDVTIDRCDIAGTAQASAVLITESANFSSSPVMVVRVRDSYLHDSLFGLRLVGSSASSYSDTQLTLTNNTIVDCDTAFAVETSQLDVALSYHNNVFAECELGVYIAIDSGNQATFGNNAYDGNSVNLAGKAVFASSDIKGDIGLSYAVTPPAPVASSLLIGAANGAVDTGVDFAGRPRDATADIGCVEASCASPPCQAVGALSCGDGTCNGAETCATCPADCGACNPAACTPACRADQFCVSGQCQFTCSGARVPGDYATLQEAITAVQPDGGTICLGAAVYDEATVVLAPKGDVTLIGHSMESTMLDGRLTINAGDGSHNLQLKGLEVADGVYVADTSAAEAITLRAMRMFRTLSTGHGLEVRRDNGRPNVLVDGCDLAGGAQGSALRVVESANFSSSPLMTVKVRSSYLHDSGQGIAFVPSSASSYSDTSLEIIGNTLVDNAVGIAVTSSQLDLSLTYFNNIIGEGTLGIDLAIDGSTSVAHGNNGLFGNVTNYQGSAVPGSGYVTSNPLLNFALSPPELGSGSPAINAGHPTYGPATDYYGRTRTGNPDLGAVERLP